MSPAFMDEQNNKPELTKRLEGTTAPISELSKKLHSAKQVADYIIAAVDKKQFVICSELEAGLLFGTLNGMSPRRGLGIVDTLIAFVAVLLGPIVRRYQDYHCARDSTVAENPETN
jgi:3-dehydrosphinganine reductase